MSSSESTGTVRATLGNKAEAARKMHEMLGNINRIIMSAEMQTNLIGVRRRNKLLEARRIVTNVIEDWAQAD